MRACNDIELEWPWNLSCGATRNLLLTSSGFLIAAPRTPEPPAAVAAVTPSAVGSIAGSEVALPPPLNPPRR